MRADGGIRIHSGVPKQNFSEVEGEVTRIESHRQFLRKLVRLSLQNDDPVLLHFQRVLLQGLVGLKRHKQPLSWRDLKSGGL